MATRGNSRARRALAGIVGLGLIVGGVPALASNSSGTADKISPAVQEQLDAEGSADVWLSFSARADLSPAYSMSWSERGQYVYDALTETVEASQAEVRAQLDAAGVDYETFFIANAIKVNGADAKLIKNLAAESDVAAVYPEFEVEQVEPVSQDVDTVSPNAVEWGVEDINAPAVWEQYTDGEGIVVASIDTGVQYDHPALVNQFRGNNGGGNFTGDYNWHDPQYGGTDLPTDGNGHGTHVTGTMTGSDGSANQIGVAPGAKWIASSGCCPSDNALMESMEWVLAPTDLSGGNADPEMRPHIVNNSWGTTLPSDDPFGEEIQEAWAAAGIFGVWANGNSGSGCSSSGSPGSRIINYSVGAYDSNHDIASFSSRGPGQDGTVKPNIAAPGVNVRSSFSGGGYASLNGTSMASPHVSGAVALLWAAAPHLVGDVEGTRALLDSTAIDTEDLQCGGTAEKNNVFGEGRLDVLALVEAAVDEQPPPPTVEVNRLEGLNRYETAVEVAKEYEGADTVYVTTGTAFADSLSGGPAASRGMIGTMATPEGDPAPVLLTRPDYLPQVTRTMLETISPSNIVILGRDAAVNESIEAELGNYADNVNRVGGADRYETAANIARQFDNPQTVYVALGKADYYADALAGSALAGTEGSPVVLTQTDSVPEATMDYLDEVPGARIVVLGGTNVVSDGVYQELGADERLGGDDRYYTSLEIAGEFESADKVFVATGLDYPDALAGGAYAGSVDGPILLVNGTRDGLNGFAGAFFEELDRLDPSEVVILGGTRAVTQEIQDEIEAHYTP